MMRCPSNWSTPDPICAAFRASALLWKIRRNTTNLPRQVVNGPDTTAPQGLERHRGSPLYPRKPGSISSRSALSP